MHESLLFFPSSAIPEWATDWAHIVRPNGALVLYRGQDDVGGQILASAPYDGFVGPYGDLWAQIEATSEAMAIYRTFWPEHDSDGAALPRWFANNS